MSTAKRIVILLALLVCGCEHTLSTGRGSAAEDAAQLDASPADVGPAVDASDTGKPAPFFALVRFDCECADRPAHTFCAPVPCLDARAGDREYALLCARADARTGAALACGPACA